MSTTLGSLIPHLLQRQGQIQDSDTHVTFVFKVSVIAQGSFIDLEIQNEYSTVEGSLYMYLHVPAC